MSFSSDHFCQNSSLSAEKKRPEGNGDTHHDPGDIERAMFFLPVRRVIGEPTVQMRMHRQQRL